MMETQVVSVHRKPDGVVVTVQSVKNFNTLHDGEILGETQDLCFDEIIFGCDADTTLKILGQEATFMERKALGNVKVEKEGKIYYLLADCLCL